MTSVTQDDVNTGRLRRLAASPQALVALDQLVFSAISFAIQITLVPVTSAALFGVFQLVLQVQIGQWFFGRAFSSEPMLVSRSAGRPDALRGAAATAVLFGTAVGIGCLLVALLLSGPGRYLLLMMAAAAPVTALHDYARYAAYTRGRPGRAILMDGGWLLGYAAVVTLLKITGTLTAYSGFGAWIAVAVVVTVVGVPRTAGWPFEFGKVRGWLREQRRIIPGYAIEGAYLAFGISATFTVATVMIGLDGFGLLRKALLPVTVLLVLFLGIGNALLARLAGREHHEVIRGPVVATGLAAGLAAIGALLTVVLPDGLMTVALGESWSVLRPAVLILIGYAVLQTATHLAVVGCKASGRPWVGPRVRTVQLVVELGLVTLLGHRYDLLGVCAGMTIAWAVAGAIAWSSLIFHPGRDVAARTEISEATPIPTASTTDQTESLTEDTETLTMPRSDTG
jgi:O-antigen/teichoic acid export membrane protein